MSDLQGESSNFENRTTAIVADTGWYGLNDLMLKHSCPGRSRRTCAERYCRRPPSAPKPAYATRLGRFANRSQYADDARREASDAGARRLAYRVGLLARCKSLAGNRG